MARTTITGLDTIHQRDQIPWDEIKAGDILFNYGYVTSLYILFVYDIRAEEMDYQILSVINMGNVEIKKYTSTRKKWDEMIDKYSGDNSYDNDNAFIYDKIREGDIERYLGDLIKQVFTTGIKVK